MWIKWADQVPTYAGASHAGIANDAFVHTVTNEVPIHEVRLF